MLKQNKIAKGFWYTLALFFVVTIPISFSVTMQRNAGKKALFEEHRHKEQGDRSLPDQFELYPTFINNWFGPNIKFSFDEEGRAEQGKHVLKIVKDNGVYYWASNAYKPLMVTASKMKLPRDFSRYVTLLSAYDGSGYIIIKHDGFSVKGACDYPAPRHAIYYEFRFDQKKTYYGHTMFFPPRPVDWCKTLETKYREFEESWYWTGFSFPL